MAFSVFWVAIAVLVVTVLVIVACVMGMQDNDSCTPSSGKCDKGRKDVYYVLLSIAVLFLVLSIIVVIYGFRNRGITKDNAIKKFGSARESLNARVGALKAAGTRFKTGVLKNI